MRSVVDLRASSNLGLYQPRPVGITKDIIAIEYLVLLAVFHKQKQIFEYIKPLSYSCYWADGLLYFSSLKLCIRLQIGAGINDVVTIEMSTTGENNKLVARMV